MTVLGAPSIQAAQLRKVRIRLLKSHLMVSRAGGDQEIRCRHGDARRARPSGEVVGAAPHGSAYRKVALGAQQVNP